MMTETVRRIVNRLLPEIRAGYHLPVFAVVESITDAPARGGLSDPFRSRYAVNVRQLTEDGAIDTAVPLLEGLQVVMTAAAQERGLLGLPQPGALVEIAWAYGRPHKPYVRGVLPDRQSLPECDADWQTWQQRHGCFQQVDDAGNWKRHTDGEINDDCRTSVLKTQERLLELVNELKTVAEHSTEDVEGIKRIEAGALKLLSAGHANLGAADNINLTGGADINLTTGRNCRSVATGSHHLEGKKVWLGDSANNVLAILGEFMTVTANALTELAGHTHGSDGLPNVKGSVEQKATEIQTSKTGKLDPMTK